MKKLLLVIGILLIAVRGNAAGGVSTATARRIVTFFSAPSGCVEGDKYYNLTSHSEFTCTSAGTWTAVGGGSTSYPLLAPDGVVGAPSYSFTNSAMTGVYSPGANALNIVTNGVAALMFSSSQTASFNGQVNALNGTVLIGAPGSVGGTLRYANASGPFQLSFTATTPAGVSRTINWNWSALTATRNLKMANNDVDLSLLGNPVGTNMALTDATTSGATPAVSNTTANSCGTTAATVAGNNTTGVITVGATAGTSCTVTFTVAAPTRRQCTVTNETTANLSRSTFLTTTTSTVEGTFAAGDQISYVCAVY